MNLKYKKSKIEAISYGAFFLALAIIFVVIQIPIIPNFAIALDFSLLPILFSRRLLGMKYTTIIVWIYPWFSLLSWNSGGLTGVISLIFVAQSLIIFDYLFFQNQKWIQQIENNQFLLIFLTTLVIIFFDISLLVLLNGLLLFPLFLHNFNLLALWNYWYTVILLTIIFNLIKQVIIYLLFNLIIVIFIRKQII